MLVRDALVAKVLAELVDALETTDDAPLEVELGRDSQIEVDVELVVMSNERARKGTAVARLQHRGLNLNEAALVEPATDARDHLRARDEITAHVFVHREVEVTLAIPGLDIRQAMEGVRERDVDLCKDREVLDDQRRLSPAGARRKALDADDVAQIDVHWAGPVGGTEKLDPA